MSILICGDTHGTHDLDKLSKKNVQAAVGRLPSEISYCIVCGDWGVIWNDDPKWLEEEARLIGRYNQMPWETLVLLGNHEGYDRIGALPWTIRHGAPVQQVSDKIFILQHGNVYTIEGKRFFVFGGAETPDRSDRRVGKEWWPQELPNQADLARGLASLKAVGGLVDYALTHTAPGPMADHLSDLDSIFMTKAADPTVGMLTKLESQMRAVKGWYFGHYHEDLGWQHYRCLFDDLVLIESEAKP